MSETRQQDEGSRSAAVFLTKVADGELHARFSDELARLGAALLEEAKRRDGKVKGELVLKLAFSVAPSGISEVGYSVKVKKPEPKTSLGTHWITPGGNFVQENPRQQTLPLREVPKAEPVREVAAPAAEGPK